MAFENLSEWISFEMKRRDCMSIREFANFVGLSHEVISRYKNRHDERYPNLETLVTLANKTNTDLCALVMLSIPQKDRRSNPTDTILSQRLSELPAEKRKMVDEFLLSYLAGTSTRDTE